MNYARFMNNKVRIPGRSPKMRSAVDLEAAGMKPNKDGVFVKCTECGYEWQPFLLEGYYCPACGIPA